MMSRIKFVADEAAGFSSMGMTQYFFITGDWQWKKDLLNNGDWLQVFLVPFLLFQQVEFPFLPVAFQVEGDKSRSSTRFRHCVNN